MTTTTNSKTDGEAGVAPATADLTSYYLVHRALREGSIRLATAVLHCGVSTEPRRLAAINKWYSGFSAELHHHHVIEDTIHFPALADRVPVMAEHAQRLTEEHDRIVVSMERVTHALAQMAAVPFNDRIHGEAIAATRELSHLLVAHLDYEDADILPLFVRHFTAQEYQVLEDRTAKSTSAKLLVFTVPFLVAAATPEEFARIWASAPAMLKVVQFLARGRYRRLTTAALG